MHDEDEFAGTLSDDTFLDEDLDSPEGLEFGGKIDSEEEEDFEKDRN